MLHEFLFVGKIFFLILFGLVFGLGFLHDLGFLFLVFEYR